MTTFVDIWVSSVIRGPVVPSDGRTHLALCRTPKIYFGHISGMVGSIDVKWKGSELVGYWVQYVTLTFDLTHDLVSRSNFKITVSPELLVWLMWNEKEGSELICYWADCMTLPCDHTHDLDLGVSRSESEIALSQEWGGRLIMNEMDVSHPFMTMKLTCVTMMEWADVPDSDRGDSRRQCAVHISSLSHPQCVFSSMIYHNTILYVMWHWQVRDLDQTWEFELNLTHWGRDKMAAFSQTTFLNGFSDVWILLRISLKCVPKIPINNIIALVQIMAWRHSGNKPLSEPMMV